MVRVVKQQYFTQLLKKKTNNFTNEYSRNAMELLNYQIREIQLDDDIISVEYKGKDVVLMHKTEKQINAICITSKKDVAQLLNELKK